MNHKMIFYTLGQILKLEAALLVLPFAVSLIYGEFEILAFVIPIAISVGLGFLLTIKKPATTNFYAKDGFVIVGLSWIVLSVIGCLPFIISGAIPKFFDALFETISGFTTTGATILDGTRIEGLTHGMAFWRCFTHWIGGMGVLVFVLAILPNADGKSIHILRAESPGPQVGKLVSKIRITARILYLIYIAITVTEIIFLVCGDMNLFEAIVHTFSTAGTGGFSTKADSIGAFSAYSQVVIGIFMLLFGMNFNLFYLLLLGNIKSVLKNEELRWYLGIAIAATIIVTFNVFYGYDRITPIGETIRNAFFSVSSIMTTTGFCTANYDLWPTLSKSILIVLMFIGSMAGSTGGGLKVSRIVILFKSFKREIKKLLHPNIVEPVKVDGKGIDDGVVKAVNSYFVAIIVIFLLACLLISIDGFSIATNITAVAACLNNVGPGLEMVGPIGNYSAFSIFSKIVLSLSMLVGRLEVYPILMLFNPRTYRSY